MALNRVKSEQTPFRMYNTSAALDDGDSNGWCNYKASF